MRHTPIEVFANGAHNRDERIHTADLVYSLRFHLHVCHEVGMLASP